MNILVIYAINYTEVRKTILDSLYCFTRYDSLNNYFYLNIGDEFLLNEINKKKKTYSGVSAIVVHYSAVSLRFSPVWWSKNKSKIISFIKRFNCQKIIIPQDEYNYTNYLQEFIKEAGINTVLTCAGEEDYIKLYPSSLGYNHIETVLTGYIDENTLDEINRKKKSVSRKIDIGYRARKVPFWLGKHSQLKTELADRFLEYLKSNDTELVCDIANTDVDSQKQNTFFGDDWIDFLMSCRTVLGCLGGSGLVDWDGSIARNVNEYCKKHPDAGFSEVEAACFEGLDNYIHLFAISPRHFECAMTKTCQILVEGDYAGIFRANVDYIELKKDFTNIDDVIQKVKNVEYCNQIADNCYEHVVKSGKYTYKKFVEGILKLIDVVELGEMDSGLCNICEISTDHYKYKIANVFRIRLALGSDYAMRYFLYGISIKIKRLMIRMILKMPKSWRRSKFASYVKKHLIGRWLIG